jgi:hypothetical protein
MTTPKGEADERAIVVEFVRDLVAAEDERRRSLEARGTSVITVSATIVTLLLGLSALVTSQQSFTLPHAARERLTLAVAAFVVAVLLAIATYVPQPARITDPAGLLRTIPKLWDREAEFWRQKITATRLDQLAAMQAANDRKARALLAAVLAQVVAVALLAWAVLSAL